MDIDLNDIQDLNLVIERTLFVNSIISSFTYPVNNYSEITREDKIRFIYYYFSKEPVVSFEEIFICFKNVDLGIDSKNLISFFSRALGMSQKPMPEQGERKQKPVLLREKSRFAWCDEYDYHDESVKYKFIKDGVLTEFSEEVANEILGALRTNGIPTKNYIVKEAIKEYVHGDLFQFIEDIKDDKLYDKVNMKKSTRVKALIH